jgi:hypothetical protein
MWPARRARSHRLASTEEEAAVLVQSFIAIGGFAAGSGRSLWTSTSVQGVDSMAYEYNPEVDTIQSDFKQEGNPVRCGRLE